MVYQRRSLGTRTRGYADRPPPSAFRVEELEKSVPKILVPQSISSAKRRRGGKGRGRGVTTRMITQAAAAAASPPALKGRKRKRGDVAEAEGVDGGIPTERKTRKRQKKAREELEAEEPARDSQKQRAAKRS